MARTCSQSSAVKALISTFIKSPVKRAVSWLPQSGDCIGRKKQDATAALARRHDHARSVHRRMNGLHVQVTVNKWFHVRFTARGAAADTFFPQVSVIAT